MLKKILVTGATGFVGSHVVEHLVSSGKYAIIASSTNETKAKAFNWFEEVTYIAADLSVPKDDYFEYFQKPDMLIHLAWKGLPNYNSHHHLDENLVSDYCFIATMIEQGLKDVTITGTCMEYGLMEGCLKETMEVNPILPYAIAKNKLREQLDELKKTRTFHLKWLRLFYLYGENQKRSSLFGQLDFAVNNDEKIFNMSKGEQIRDYLTVEKMAEYICKTALQNNLNGIINCCSGKGIKVIELVENYLKQKKSEIKLNLGYYPYPAYEPFEFWGDNSKLKMILLQDGDKT